jgi:predicted AAA+ superfamily ATPase
MTLLELSTDLSGRYVSFRVNPLSFEEIVKMNKISKKDYEKTLLDYFKWGGLPQRFSFNENIDKENYLSSVYDSIILKDIVDRLGIKDIASFNKVLQYILDTESREFSRDNAIEFLKKEYHEVANDTLYNYLEAFTSTFIMNKVYRYDIHGKNILKTLNKYYCNDLGIKQIKTNSEELNLSVALENVVYNDLIGKNYKVYIGKTKKGEIDFVAIKNNVTKYIQVSYDLSNEETRAREVNAFNEFDSDEKYIITMDKNDYDIKDVHILNVIDFLMNDTF